MLNKKNIKITLIFALITSTRLWAQVTEGQEKSWKYLIERKMTNRNNLLKKTDEQIDRAFIYYGKGREKAGGQVKAVPQVVYIDANDQPLEGAIHISPSFVPTDPNKFGLVQNLIDNIGSEPNFPVSAGGLPSAFSFLPLKSEVTLKEGHHWYRVLFVLYGEPIDINDAKIFPVVIEQKVRGYEIKKGRKCAIIDYKVNGIYETLGLKLTMKGSGTVYYDNTEDIIVEKEQTISMSRFGEVLDVFKEGTIKKRIYIDDVEKVNIKISLQNEKDNRSAKHEDIGGIFRDGNISE